VTVNKNKMMLFIFEQKNNQSNLGSKKKLYLRGGGDMLVLDFYSKISDS
jgi:hypothetical protein